MALLTRHFWKFFFALIAIIATGVFVIYIAGLFDGREGKSVEASGESASQTR